MTYEELAEEWDTRDVIACRTSGSTGTPKSIMLPKEQMLNSARRTAHFFGLDKKSLLYSCISPDFIGGKMMLARQRLLGCKFIWETPSNSPLANYQGEKITLLSVVPSQMHYILDNRQLMPEIEAILIGGSPIPMTMRQRIADSGLQAFETYGMTETASHIAIRKVESEITPFSTLGDIMVTQDNGVLCINIPGWQTLRTNDNANLISDRQFFILGRVDNVIISGGVKLNPEIIEEKLSLDIQHPFIITSVSDEKWGERVVLVIEGDESFKNKAEAICRQKLSRFEIPKEIIFIDKLPRTENGKIIRRKFHN